MALGVGIGCMKYTLFTVNIITFLLGGALLGIGVYAVKTGTVGQHVEVPPIPLGAIVLGSVMFVIGFFGCCGSARESRLLLGLYFLFVLLLMIAQIGVGLGAYSYSDDVSTWVEQGWNKADTQWRSDIENELQCCGFKSPGDDGLTSCTAGTVGCYYKLVDFVSTRLQAVEIAAISVGAVQLVALVFACCLFTAIPTEEDERRTLLEDSRRIIANGAIYKQNP